VVQAELFNRLDLGLRGSELEVDCRDGNIDELEDVRCGVAGGASRGAFAHAGGMRLMSAAPMQGLAMTLVDQTRREANAVLNPERKVNFGQYMTPASVALFMASLFSKPHGVVRLLDAGAGVGSLIAAFIERWGANSAQVTAYEIDEQLVSYLRSTLTRLGATGIAATVIDRDFIQDSVYRIKLGKKSIGYTHAILNPPYKKINNDSAHRGLMRAVGLETVNLYTAFVGLALELTAEGGEIVAIIPRSFCNGLYYRPFREWMLQRASLEHIHLFHSRTSAFTDDAVLQENVIVKLVRGKNQDRVTITTSSDTTFEDIQSHSYPFREIVHAGETQQFIHVPTAPTHGELSGVPLARHTLDEIGLTVSTGPVVDFRLSQFLRANPGEGTVPLLYPGHFAGGGLVWPRETKKPNALANDPDVQKWLYPNGFYTVVRRFSSKEELRRIVASVVDPGAFDARSIGFENHLNVFHARKQGIDGDVAHGLSIFLNTTAIDEYFRRFSGHTQVNATDLRQLLYPQLTELKELGQWARKAGRVTQEMIDRRVESLNGTNQ